MNSDEQKELNESQARIQAILDTAVDAIITIDDHGIIVSANPAVERMFGYAPSEILGRNVSMLMPSPYREQHDQYISNYLTSGHAQVIGIGREVQAQRKDGATFPIELALSEVKLSDRCQFTGIIRDITIRKRVCSTVRSRLTRRHDADVIGI